MAIRHYEYRKQIDENLGRDNYTLAERANIARHFSNLPGQVIDDGDFRTIKIDVSAVLRPNKIRFKIAKRESCASYVAQVTAGGLGTVQPRVDKALRKAGYTLKITKLY